MYPALIFYEYIITFGQEVELFWRGKLTGAQEVELFWRGKLTGAVILFMANRYFSLGYWVYVTAVQFLPSENYSPSVRVPSEAIQHSTGRLLTENPQTCVH